MTIFVPKPSPGFPSLTRDEVFRIETRRLWLRWPRLESAAAMAEWNGLPEVATQTSTLKVGLSASEMSERIETKRAENCAGSGIHFVMVRKSAHAQPIGMIGVGFTPAGDIELGYHLDPAFRGQGFATEAARALCAQVFELTAATEIVAAAWPDNVGSVRVLERCGFKQSGKGIRESSISGQRPVVKFTLARSRPSALLAAQLRFHPARLQAAADRIKALAS